MSKVGIYYNPVSGNADCMGGFGVGFRLGTKLAARIAKAVKSKGVVIPDMNMAYLAAMLETNGHEVIITDKWDGVDELYLNTSIATYKNDLINARKSSCQVIFAGSLVDTCQDLFAGYSTIHNILVQTVHNYRPAWHLYDVSKFRYFPSLKVHPIVYYQASTGCKFKCDYCPYYSYYRDWKPVDIEKVAIDLTIFKNRYDLKGVVFRDPLFTGNIMRTRDLCKILKRLKLKWVCETRPECLHEDLVWEMADSGCAAIHIGVESADDTVLKNVNRRTYNLLEKTVDFIHECKINTTCFFLIGLPEDTRETIERTINLACRLNPTVAEFFVATPVPGTEMYNRVELLHTDYTKYDFYSLVYKHKNLAPEEIKELRERAYRKFYLRPAWVKEFLKRYRW